uniref:Uncharacterized protein n=1 Tax=Timema bartmani TaxID=61472 RepID=A0A7R9ESX4_9NEOP|nr:unnamed protein product [Timema bartmani]
MSKEEPKKLTHINVEHALVGVWTKASVSSCRGLLVMGVGGCIQPNDAVSYHLSDVMDAVKNHDCSSFACDHRAMSGVAGPR